MTDSAQNRADIAHPAIPPHPGALGESAAGLWHRHRWLRWTLIAACVLALVLIARAVFWPSETAKPPLPPVPVGVAKVTTGNMHVVLTGLGTVTPTATVTVQTQINGQLTEVGFKEGQIVQKGEFLAQIDSRPYEVALSQAQGALAHDTGLLNQAKSDLARYVALARVNAISAQIMTDQEFLVQQDSGTVMEDQALVKSAELNLAYCHIVAPVTGRAGLRLVDPGNYVQTSSSTGLVVLTELQPITVIFVLPESDIPAIAAQMQGPAPLAVEAYDPADDKQLAQGTLTTLDNTVDTTTGTVKLRAAFPNTDRSLFPNEFVNARLVLKTLNKVAEVSVQAVQNGAPGTFVYLVKPDGTAHVQVVKTGVTDGDNVQIVGGLKPGDRVVIDGVSLLRDGAKVKIATSGRNRPHATNTGPGAPPGEQPQNAASGSKPTPQ